MSTPGHVIVGISGGVDSAVAALLLREQGYRVEGLFMRNWDDPDDPGHCPAQRDLEAAEAACARLGIPLRRVDFTAEYWHRVFEHFLAEYAAGRTPNPDVLCNREIKFGTFLQHARALGADAVATGHYARIGRAGDGDRRLLRGTDAGKDQSYFLHAVDQDALARALFPLGDWTKAAVRERAHAAGLPNHDRADSTGICFIGERRLRDFLSAYLPARPGPMETPAGAYMGAHHGLMYYTVGQRRGLGIGGGRGAPGQAWYVLAKDVARNALVVGQGHDHPWLYAAGLHASGIRWIAGRPPALPLACEAQVRYRQRPVPCRVEACAAPGAVQVRFATPQRAITPGQAVVFYDGPVCLGGGVIERAEAGAEGAAAAVG